jgi:hypothetical protein
MSLYDRAAQFGSFDALTGHSEAISETARLTDKKLELNEEQINDLNNKVNVICNNILSKPKVTITYFVPDERKSGGMYVTEDCVVKKVNLNDKIFTTIENKLINIEDIWEIQIK